jgi:putative restriction endonuclease
MVSGHIEEDLAHPYSLTKLQGKTISLSKEVRYHPSHDNLEWHRREVFKG